MLNLLYVFLCPHLCGATCGSIFSCSFAEETFRPELFYYYPLVVATLHKGEHISTFRIFNFLPSLGAQCFTTTHAILGIIPQVGLPPTMGCNIFTCVRSFFGPLTPCVNRIPHWLINSLRNTCGRWWTAFSQSKALLLSLFKFSRCRTLRFRCAHRHLSGGIKPTRVASVNAQSTTRAELMVRVLSSGYISLRIYPGRVWLD